MTKHILVVDDELKMRRLLQMVMEEEGHEVAVAEDGSQALELIRGEGFDLVITDVKMPKVDGREILRRIKEDEELRKIPVIMLTTTDEAGEIDRCYEMGCSFYMVKPADYNKFMAAVENLGAFLSLKEVTVPPVNGDRGQP